MWKCVYTSHYFCNYLLDLLPLQHRYKSPLTRSQHKPLLQPFPPRAKTKMKKEYNRKAWEKETSHRAKWGGGGNKKTEKYSTNERTRYKLTRPKKQRGNKQSTQKIIQNKIVKCSKDLKTEWRKWKKQLTQLIQSPRT